MKVPAEYVKFRSMVIVPAGAVNVPPVWEKEPSVSTMLVLVVLALLTNVPEAMAKLLLPTVKIVSVAWVTVPV